MNTNLMVEWIKKRAEKVGTGLSAFLIGSILNKPIENCNDVDLVICFNTDMISIDSILFFLKELRTEFIEKFEKPLHITTFTNNEASELKSFLEKQPHKLIINGKEY